MTRKTPFLSAVLLITAFSTSTTAALAAAPAARQQLQLSHHLPASKAAALAELVASFNASDTGAEVVLSRTDWREAGAQMHILEGEEEETFVAGKPRFKPVHAIMKEAGIALQTLRPPAMMTRTPVDNKGQLLALPVGLSTPVLYLNREAFRQAGVNPDTAKVATWLQLQDTLGELADRGHGCPYTVAEPGRVMVENLSAWHNEPIARTVAKGKQRNQTLSFNGMFQVKHVAMMASWSRARYLHVFGPAEEAEQRFSRGDCAVIAAASASWADFRHQGRTDISVVPLPYHDDFPGAPQNTVADGPALWVVANRKPAEYKAVARFIAFWLQPQNQVAWQRATGYLPLNRAGLLASQSELLGDDLDNVRVAVAQLTHKPATADSAAQPLLDRARVRRILDEELAGVWDDSKAAKEALDNAVVRAAAQ